MNDTIIQLDIQLFNKASLIRLRHLLRKELKRNEKELKLINTPATRYELRQEGWGLVRDIGKLNIAIINSEQSD